MNRNIIFIKTHKCASTTIQNYLLVYAKSNQLKVLSPYRRGINDTPYSQQPLKYKLYIFLKKPFNLNINHSPYEPYLTKIIPNAICITSVREPLSRAISHYYSFIHSSAPIPYQKTFSLDFNQYYRSHFKDDKLSRDNIKYGINNYMSKWLGFDNETEITKESLRQRYYFIGLKENMNKTEAIVKKIVNIKEDLPIAIENKNQEYKAFQIADDVRELFIKNNQSDYKLYNLAEEIFNDYRVEDFGAR